MMRYIFIFLCSIIYSGIASQPLPDGVKTLYNAAKTDAEKGKCLYPYLISIKEDSNYFNTLLELSSYFKNKNDQPGQDYVQLSAASKLAETGDFATALIESHQLLSNFEKRHDDYGKINAYSWIGFALDESGDFEQAISYYKKVVYAASPTGDKQMLSRANNDLSSAYAQLNMGDSGLAYAQQSVTIDYEINDSKHLCYSLATVGENYIAKKEYDLATPFIKRAYLLSLTFNDSWPIAWSLNDLAQIFLETNRHDSARRYAQMAVELANEKGFIRQSLRAYEYLYRSFEKTDTKDSVYKYFRLAISTKDSLYTAKKAKDIQAMNFREQLRQQEIEQDKIQLQNKIRTYSMLAGLVVFSIIAFILYRNNRGKQKANKVLQSTLNNLRSTQSQLIQSEKMASLGELTAGIAHEIQNPLNFVNNFSEVSNELIDEMNVEIDNGNSDEVKAIAKDIKQNLEKINHHGKRADAIVKGMLQHSQTSTGQKESTNINKLADEYLRLAYHGLRAKDKSFNAALKTDFDETIGNINIIPQDIGRVILNLITNAFYATNEKQKQNVVGYEPTVTISTKRENDKIRVSVKDNGNGIPQKITDKIFQPFFTTKPTGQGTGLGLSLAYDIVKAHGGELKVETKENEGCEFIIQLPSI